MAFLNQEFLLKMNFKKLGKNVLISEKASIYNPEKIEVGDDSRIDDFCVISGRVKIGNNVHITVFCNIAGGTEGVYIEDFSTVAYGCHLFSQSDDYSGETMTNSTIPSHLKSERKKAVYVKKHCIIGTKSIIFPGVTLSEGTAVGAASLINKSTESWSIYVGVPAKKIKDRSKNLLILVDDYLKQRGSSGMTG